MKIFAQYNFYNYNNNPQKNSSFGSAASMNLQFIRDNHSQILPLRIKKLVDEISKRNPDEISLRDLHLKTYKKLLSCPTLDSARNEYPEFTEVLPYKSAMRKSSVNTRRIEQHMNLDDLPLYLLQERWGRLKSLEEIAAGLGLPSRNSLTYIMDVLRIPEFGKNYQTILNSTDEVRNNIIAQKTKAYNAAHSEWVRERNTKLAQDARNIRLNRELFEEVWARMPQVKADMSAFRAEHPNYTDSEFYQGFWDTYPEYKLLQSKLRKEIAAERRSQRNLSKKS